jgi:hypothetical protein
VAIRRDTIRQQALEALAPAVQQTGGRVTGGVYAITGPSPWLMNELGLIGQFFVKYYFVAVTEQQVFFLRMNRMTNRPGEIEYAAPRQAVQVTDYKRRPLWSSFKMMAPGMDKPLRLNVHRIWREDLDFFGSALGIAAPVQ